MELLEVTYLYEHSLAGILVVETLKPCRVQQIFVEDVGIFEQVRPMRPQKVAQFRQRFERGHLCYGAYLDDRCAHFSWVQTQGLHYIESARLTWSLKPGEFFIYDCRTADWARGYRLYPFVLAHILEEFRRQAFKKGLIYTTQSNLASQKGIQRAGFTLRQKMRLLRIGSLALRVPGLPR